MHPSFLETSRNGTLEIYGDGGIEKSHPCKLG